MGDLINDILRAADKHPNSRVSKLIRSVEEEPSQKNIVLLLIELSEHAEYVIDFNISLRYYLELFERLGINRDLILNEAGLLLVNSSKIYSKRVDYVQSLVERQIMTLSNADHEIQQQKEQNQQDSSAESATPTEKPKRGRKRALDAPTDPYEVQLEPKKFKKMTPEKRFALPKTPTKTKSLLRNIEVEQQIHPACWMHATIYDLENDEDVDTKRNYKLFTYHVEHRYNTLVPDINFRLHFKVKDYMDAQEEEMDGSDEATNQVWPPLSEEYVQKYIHLENHVLQQEIDPSKSWNSPHKLRSAELERTNNETLNETTNNLDISLPNLNTSLPNNSSNINDSGMGTSVLESSLDNSQLDTTGHDSTLNNTTILLAESDKSLNSTQNQENDSALGESLLDQTNDLNESNTQLNSTNETSVCVDNTLNNSTVVNEVSTLSNQLDQTTNTADTEVQTTQHTESPKETEDGGKLECGNVDMTLTSSENGVSSSESKDPAKTSEVCSTEVNDGGDAVANIGESSEVSNETCSAAACPTEANDCEDAIAKTSESEKIVNKIQTPAENNPNSKEDSGEDICEENKDSANAEPTTAILDNSDKDSGDGVQPPPTTEDINNQEAVSTEKSLQDNGESTKDNEAFMQLEIHVLKDNENEPSERLQLRVPNTDDEGVHLSDAYEDDLRLMSPTIKLPNIMPGVTNKDVTIYLDKELREALELRDGMMEHFSHETYKVPVVEEPKEQPLLFNILQLPRKLLRKKVLFKLGPEMDLFLKARSLKSTRPTPPPKEYRMLKALQFFPLNSTDMTGVIDTPPNSPGHGSDFCGFTDDEVMQDEDTCTEFCGFTEDEQNHFKVITHRLSRDSGVGVDVATLTPEKETLQIIFEETDDEDMTSCKVDLMRKFTNSENAASTTETTDELLDDLPASIRNVLQSEFQDESIGDGVESTKGTTTEVEAINATCYTEENSLITSDKNIEEQLATEELNSNSNALQSKEAPNKDTTQDIEKSSTGSMEKNETQPEESRGEHPEISVVENVTNKDISQDKESPSVDLNENDKTQSEENSGESLTESKEEPNSLINKETLEEYQNKDTPVSNGDATKADDGQRNNVISASNEAFQESDTIGLENDNDNDSDNSQQDTELFDLNLQGTKTKIQQWHEHLRPILAKSKERHHFDVFQLGTEIIDTIQSSDIDEQNPHSNTSFDNIMDQKDKSYVSRYFLSTLLLANQSNVNIFVENKSSEKPSAWSDIKLKLLSTKRHTVAIEDNIGMINNKKRKQQPSNEDNVKKKKTTTSQVLQDQESVESLDDCKPLVKLKSSMTKLKGTPTKRHMNCDAFNAAEKKLRETNNSSTCIQQAMKAKEVLVISQQLLPPFPGMDLLMDVPTTSKQANRSIENCEVNLNNIRILQPIEKVPRQGDDYDSGIFSIGEMSSTS